QPRALQIRARNPGGARIDLERDHLPARRQRARQPDGAVPAQRPHLENPPRPQRLRQDLQKPPLRRGDIDGRQPPRRAIPQPHLPPQTYGSTDSHPALSLIMSSNQGSSTTPLVVEVVMVPSNVCCSPAITNDRNACVGAMWSAISCNSAL